MDADQDGRHQSNQAKTICVFARDREGESPERNPEKKGSIHERALLKPRLTVVC